MKKEKQRFSGIELLRILAACGVVMLHYNDGRAFNYVSAGSSNHMVLFALESLCICAVNLFMLMSGYFLCRSQKRVLGKPLELLVQVVVFAEGFYLLKVVLGMESFALGAMLDNLVPNSYFVILYTVVYFVSPYVNVLLKHLSRKGLTGLMVLLLVVFSVYPTLVDLSGEILGKEWYGLSSIAAKGSLQGFNIVNFLLLYCVGAYLRLHDVKDAWKRPRVLLPVLAVCVALIFGWSLLNEHTSRFGLRSAWVYHNPLVILEAVVLFLLFAGMKLQSRIINGLAKGAFTCFLLHGRLLDYIGIKEFTVRSVPVMLIHICISIVGIYLVSWVVHQIYRVCTAWLFTRLDRVKLPKPDEIDATNAQNA